MTERQAPFAKLLIHLGADGPLATALAPGWAALAPQLGDRFGLDAAQLDGLRDDALAALTGWAEQRAAAKAGRAPLHQWLVRMRQALSLEEVLLVLVHVDRALRQASWQLGLSGPDWQALSELLSQFIEALFEEAAAGWQGVLAQNHQLRDELAYFQRLAASLEIGAPLDEHLALAVRETARLLHCEFCAILLPKEGDPDVLAIRAAVAPRVIAGALDGMAFPLAENGLIAQVFLTGAPASTYQPLEDLEITLRRRHTLESLGFSQLMAYPLQTHGRVLGVLTVANRLDDQPWQALEEAWLGAVASQLSASVRLSQLQTRQLSGEDELLAGLGGVAAVADAQLAAHGAAVGRLARALGAALGLSGRRLDQLEAAGQLANLGLLAPEMAPRHRPGPLWAGEREIIKAHAGRAEALVLALPTLAPLAPAIRHHHERWDGTGYPDKLRANLIPLEARILAVADAFAALSAHRPHRAALEPDQALAEIRRGAGSQFDPLVVQALESSLGGASAGLLIAPTEPTPTAPFEPSEAATLLAHGGRLLALLADGADAEDAEAYYERAWRAVAANCAFDAFGVWRAIDSARLSPARLTGLTDASALGALESYAAACRVPVAVADAESETRYANAGALASAGFSSALALPLVASDRLIGVLSVYRRVYAPFSPSELAALELASAMLALGLEAIELRSRHALALGVDALSGLASARAFGERLSAECRRAERFGLGLCALLLDLDGFAAYNEAHGFTLGDEALKQVAELITARLGPGHLAARLEGDAFAVLLPESGVEEAVKLADELRLAVASTAFAGRVIGGARLTASVGVTTLASGAGAGLLGDLRTALAKARAQGPGQLLFYAAASAAEPAAEAPTA